MADSNEIKAMVKEKYGEIAKSKTDSGCCGTTGCCGTADLDYSIMSDDYTKLEGYVAEADLNLGCGIPVEHANIKKGDVVIDLGSGAGNDVFVARSIVGDTGKVIGIDMTEEMLKKAVANNVKLGFENVEFKLGDIEELPLESNLADVVVSNCVLNLVPDKNKAFGEIHRVLKAKGHFCISDVVLSGELPEDLRKSAEMYAGCVSGAIQQDEYLGIINRYGFTDVEIKASKKIDLPEEVLRKYLKDEQYFSHKESNVGIHSITVVGTKKCC